MAVDSRIKDLPEEVSSAQLQALLDTLYLAVDESSFTNAKKILLKTLFFDAIVTSNANDYQALTPKAFYNTIMTTSLRGLGRLATDNEVTSKSGDGLLSGAHQVLMQTQWYKDWFVKEGIPSIVYANSEGAGNQKALAFTVNFNQSIPSGGMYYIGPALLTGRAYKLTWYQFGVANSVISHAGLGFLKYEGIQVLDLLTTGMYLGITGNGLLLFFHNSGAADTFRFSGDFNVILD